MKILCKTWILGQLLLLGSCTHGKGQSINLANQGKSAYQIDILSPGNPAVTRGAGEFQKYFGKITGVQLAIVKTGSSQGHVVLIGTQADIRKLYPTWKARDLGTDGYALFTEGSNLVVAGGKGKGALFGVYTLLEKYLGCRMYTPSVTVIPQQRSVTLSGVDLTEVPRLIFRDVFYHPAFDVTYADWHKLTPAKTAYSSSWGTWAHTSLQLVPPSSYFKTHPEYYSLVKGKRTPDQLNYTDPGVYQVLLGALNAKIKSQPQFQYWSVGQEDNNNYCQCDDCGKVYQATGSPSGTIVEFVNKIAKFFPSKTISTLAYTYSRKPPKQVKLAPNLNIMFCTDISGYVSDYATAPDHQSLRNELGGWKALTDNIFVWDYIVNYKALESIYPNLLKLKPNLQYLIAHGAKGYYAQGDYYPGGEFSELRSYLMAKLLWNPDADDQAIIQDFLQGFYGKAAAPFLWKYIQLTSSELTGGPDRLTPAEADTYYQLFQQAESAIKGQTAYLQRVQKEQTGLDYSIIQMYLHAAKTNPGTFFRDPKGYQAFNATTDRFLKDLVASKTTRLVHAEHNIPLFQYIQQWKSQMNALRKGH